MARKNSFHSSVFTRDDPSCQLPEETPIRRARPATYLATTRRSSSGFPRFGRSATARSYRRGRTPATVRSRSTNRRRIGLDEGESAGAPRERCQLITYNETLPLLSPLGQLPFPILLSRRKAWFPSPEPRVRNGGATWQVCVERTRGLHAHPAREMFRRGRGDGTYRGNPLKKKREKRTGRTRQRLTKPVHQFRKFRIPKESGRRGPRTRPQQTTSRLIKKRAPMSQFRRGFVLTRTTAATKKKRRSSFPARSLPKGARVSFSVGAPFAGGSLCLEIEKARLCYGVRLIASCSRGRGL